MSRRSTVGLPNGRISIRNLNAATKNVTNSKSNSQKINDLANRKISSVSVKIRQSRLNKQRIDVVCKGKNTSAVTSTTSKSIKRTSNTKSRIPKKKIKRVTFAKRVTTIPITPINHATIATFTLTSPTMSADSGSTPPTDAKGTASTNRKRKRSADHKTTSSIPKVNPSTTAQFPPLVASSPTVDCKTLDQGVRLKAADYSSQQSCEDLARYLLGKRLVARRSDQHGAACRVSGRIVETEAYLGGADKASHSYNGKMTERTEAMYMDPGTAYVYNIYGTQCCLNVSSVGPGAAVLIRAIEPMEGIEILKRERSATMRTSVKSIKLCNGPSKLTQAFGIAKNACNKLDLASSTSLWIEDHPADPIVDKNSIVTSARIGMGKSAGDWATKPLRFYVGGCPSVSVRDKQAESQLKSSSA